VNPILQRIETIGFPDRPTLRVLVANSFSLLSFDELMEVYAESNEDNTRFLYLELPMEKRLAAVRQGFKDYLVSFFEHPNNRCFILFAHDLAVSALRIKETEHDQFLIEGLETRKDMRGQGLATLLLQTSIDHVLAIHPNAFFESHASNLASVKIHRNVGFAIERSEVDGGAWMSRNPND
jgi:predicted GNAT family acetyltransferase